MGITEIYRGWNIGKAFVGYDASHPDYDGFTDDEGSWIDNGLMVRAMTVEDVKAQIDCVEEENG